MWDAGRQPPDGPPVWTALNARPRGMPPPMSKMISRSEIPIGTSMRPVLFTFPTSENTFVPELPFHAFSLTSPVPIDVNHSAPRLMMSGTFAQVSTLLRLVGRFL